MSIYKNLSDSDDDRIISLFDEFSSVSGILRGIGYSNFDARAHKFLVQKADELGIKRKTISRRTYTKEQLAEAVRLGYSYSDVLTKLGLSVHTSNYGTLKQQINDYQLSIDHFNQQKSRNRNHPIKPHTAASIFVENSSASRSTVRKWVLQWSVLPYKCSGCDNDGMWKDTTLTLELDHINGNPKDHRVNNLRFLCPNCHSQTVTYRNQRLPRSLLQVR